MDQETPSDALPAGTEVLADLEASPLAVTESPLAPQAIPAATSPQEPVAPIVVMRPRSQAWTALAAILIAMTSAGTFLTWHFLPSARLAQRDATRAASQVYADFRAAAEHLAQAAGPSSELNTLVETALGELAGRGKFVVLTRTLPVHVEKRSTRRVLWDQFDIEDSTVRLRVSNNTVQYYLPLEGLTAANVRQDPAANRLTITLPEPRLDRDMVGISANPGDWLVEKHISWSRVSDWSGAQLEAQARAEIRRLVIAAGEEPLVLKEAREQAYVQVAAFVKSIVSSLAPGLQIEVKFDPSLNPPYGTDTWQPSNAPLS